MKRCSTAELRKLEIINLCDGARLGYASDFEFDKEDAKILALVISGSDGFFGLCREDDIVIPWHKIECFGEDTILVRLSASDLSCCLCPRPKKKGFRF
ncbi:MAG: YlmC/YmxH family sporulation protein [Clostridia bacterium]|nr:YlmC/YmxH family sporulation protein [Clostridia bacterium]